MLELLILVIIGGIILWFFILKPKDTVMETTTAKSIEDTVTKIVTVIPRAITEPPKELRRL